ncbi:hypothetical protein CDCA_CDCA09G2580 [Cyanidium caldarium]|uniref:SGNH hydrolase-type esterase domain-containing protein n=1 Tax=Cyanidium caldarium TaxID=2771 RepID=A0AAV9IW63_CYACA|nr:hypothetical protein CDCA_CDCA09G2580 [Cyanidium caldarium]
MDKRETETEFRDEPSQAAGPTLAAPPSVESTPSSLPPSYAWRTRLEHAARAVSRAVAKTRTQLEHNWEEWTRRDAPAPTPLFLCVGDSLTYNAVRATDEVREESAQAPGWGVLLQQTYNGKADVCFRGFSGYNSRWVLPLLPSILGGMPRERLRLMVVWLGANDAVLPGLPQHVDVETYASNLYEMVTMLARHVRGRRDGLFWASSTEEASADENAQKPDHQATGDRGDGAAPQPVTSTASPCIILVTPPAVDEQGRVRLADDGTAAGAPDRRNAYTAEYARACMRVASQVHVGVPVHALNVYESMLELGDGAWQKLLCDGLHWSRAGQQWFHQTLVRFLRQVAPHLAPDALPDVACPWRECLDRGEPAAPAPNPGPNL